jgi:hypothetical protein
MLHIISEIKKIISKGFIKGLLKGFNLLPRNRIIKILPKLLDWKLLLSLKNKWKNQLRSKKP